jgi:hypothetical protein
VFEVHEKLPFAKYRELPGLHASSLKYALDSAQDYQHAELHGWPDSETFRQGRAGHTAVFEPQRFLSDYVLWETEREDGTKRIRRGKEWDEFQALHSTKTILTPEQYRIACEVRDVVRDHPVAGPLVRRPGKSEVSLRWTHKRSGATCKARPDHVTDRAIVDLKLTADPSPRIFGNLAARLRYHLQGGMYRDGVEACGLGRLPFKIIAVRVAKNKPLDVVVYDLGDDVLGQGQEEYERAIDIVQECRKKQQWPGMAVDHELPLFLPAWAGPQLTEEPITFGGEAML